MSRGFIAVVGLVAAICLLFPGCPGGVDVVYEDGYFFVTGVPSGIRAVTVRMSAGTRTYRQTITVAIVDGRSEQICIGAMYRRTYSPGELEIIARDEDAEVVARARNRVAITLDGTREVQEIPYDQFEAP